MRAVSWNGLCQYAICIECYDKNKPKRIRGAKDKTVWHSNTQKHDQCCHRLYDLYAKSDPSVAKCFVMLKLGKVESLVA